MRDPEEACYLGNQTVIRQTDQAVLVVNEAGDQQLVPHSVIDDDSDIFKGVVEGYRGELVVAFWWAEKEGFT